MELVGRSVWATEMSRSKQVEIRPVLPLAHFEVDAPIKEVIVDIAPSPRNCNTRGVLVCYYYPHLW